MRLKGNCILKLYPTEFSVYLKYSFVCKSNMDNMQYCGLWYTVRCAQSSQCFVDVQKKKPLQMQLQIFRLFFQSGKRVQPFFLYQPLTPLPIPIAVVDGIEESFFFILVNVRKKCSNLLRNWRMNLHCPEQMKHTSIPVYF